VNLFLHSRPLKLSSGLEALRAAFGFGGSEMDDKALRAAYEATEYRVSDSPVGPLVIRIGEVNAALDRLLGLSGATRWAYITACNPRSVIVSDGENRLRTEALLERLARFTIYRGEGVGADGHPPEASLGRTRSSSVGSARRRDCCGSPEGRARRADEAATRRGPYACTGGPRSSSRWSRRRSWTRRCAGRGETQTSMRRGVDAVAGAATPSREAGLTAQDLRLLSEMVRRAGGFQQLREFLDVLGGSR
jgi:hypothetical protein